jgi:V/A-type H+-transporting ATPase subunit E
MTEQERADQRIQAICEKIRSETLDPAKEQAQEILEQAKKEAEQIRHTARHEAEKIRKEMLAQMHEEKQIFQSSLQQACKQAVEQLMQKIEQALFNPALLAWIQDQLGDAASYAKLIDVLVSAIHKEGTRTEVAVLVPKHFSADVINAHLSQHILNSLKDKSVQLSDINGGVLVHLENKKMTLDLSEKTLQEIISSFIRKDFRKIFFKDIS